MTTITLPRATVEQALEALEDAKALLNNKDRTTTMWFADEITALRAALAQQAALAQERDPVAHSGWVLREVLFDNGEPIGHREPQHSPAALAQQAYTDDLNQRIKLYVGSRLGPPQPAEPQTTHSAECWRWHHRCAVAKIERECKHD